MIDLFDDKLERELPNYSNKPSFNPKWIDTHEGRKEFKLDKTFVYETLLWKHRIRFVIYPNSPLINVFSIKMHKAYAVIFKFLSFLDHTLKINILFSSLAFLKKIGMQEILIKESNNLLTFNEVYLKYDYYIPVEEDIKI